MIKRKPFQSVTMSAVILLSASIYLSGCGKQTEQAMEKKVESTSATDLPHVEDDKPKEKVENLPSENEVMQEVGEVKPDEEVASGENADYEIIPTEDTKLYAIQKVNIRKGPGTQYDKVGSLSYGQEIISNGRVEDNGKVWLVIKTGDGSKQMVSGTLVSYTNPNQHQASQTSQGNNDQAQQPQSQQQQTQQQTQQQPQQQQQTQQQKPQDQQQAPVQEPAADDQAAWDAMGLPEMGSGGYDPSIGQGLNWQ